MFSGRAFRRARAFFYSLFFLNPGLELLPPFRRRERGR
jgi:hypothetical protein